MNINISEADFTVLATAAMDAKAAGDMQQAQALDKIARKMNAAISNANAPKIPGFNPPPGLRWDQVPCTLL